MCPKQRSDPMETIQIQFFDAPRALKLVLLAEPDSKLNGSYFMHRAWPMFVLHANLRTTAI